MIWVLWMWSDWRVELRFDLERGGGGIVFGFQDEDPSTVLCVVLDNVEVVGLQLHTGGKDHVALLGHRSDLLDRYRKTTGIAKDNDGVGPDEAERGCWRAAEVWIILAVSKLDGICKVQVVGELDFPGASSLVHCDCSLASVSGLRIVVCEEAIVEGSHFDEKRGSLLFVFEGLEEVACSKIGSNTAPTQDLAMESCLCFCC